MFKFEVQISLVHFDQHVQFFAMVLQMDPVAKEEDSTLLVVKVPKVEL